MFTDETGLLMSPLRRTTLAPRGRTPVLEQRASHRDRVSVAAALWRTPARGLVRLHYRTYPDQFVNGERYALFLEELLDERLRRQPAVLVVHDRGMMHRGEAMDALLDERPRLLQPEHLPAYAPELNPVEALWNWLKLNELANFAPRDVPHLDAVLNDKLQAIRRDQPRLRTFLAATPLRW